MIIEDKYTIYPIRGYDDMLSKNYEIGPTYTISNDELVEVVGPYCQYPKVELRTFVVTSVK